MYPQYATTYVITLIFSIIAVCAVIKYSKTWKQDNIQNSGEGIETSSKLNKYNALIEEKKKVGNIIIKDMLKLPLLIILVWYIGIFYLSAINGKNLLEQDSFVLLFILLLPIPVIILPCFLMSIYYINIDNRLIKKYKLNINDNVDITKVKSLHIFRPIENVKYEKFFIVDTNNNLLYKIQKKGNFKPKYLIMDSNDIKQGEININIFSLNPEYIVRLIGEEPYSIRAKFQLAHNYNVTGRNYIIKGDVKGITNIIYNLNEEKQALIFPTSTKNNRWAILGSTDVTIVNSNNIDLTLISFCLTHGNFHRAIHEMDRFD